jgi:ABC-type uncharacterized transport system ATPase subunit
MIMSTSARRRRDPRAAGENGAGKASVHILYGLARPDGNIVVRGAPVHLTSPRDMACGIGMVLNISCSSLP